MSGDFTHHTCVSVRCGVCKEPYEDDEYGSLHFGSREEAADWITAVGWKVDGDVIRCRDCANREDCAAMGDIWDEWWDCRCGCHSPHDPPRNRNHCQPMECRTCARCDNVEERAVGCA